MTPSRPGFSVAENALLELCTCSSGAVAAAWSRWVETLPADLDARDDDYPSYWRDLLPLAGHIQRQHGLAGPQGLLSRLRAASVLEERRLEAVRATTAEIIATAAIAAAHPLVVGGLGIGETVYPHPASRHTGVLFLMLAAGSNLPRLLQNITPLGYRTRQAGRRASYWPFLRWARVWLVHPSGFQVYLFSAPPWRAGHRLGHARLQQNARLVTCPGGLRFQTPQIEDALALLDAGVGRERGPRSLLPFVDAALLRRSLNETANVSSSRRASPSQSGDEFTQRESTDRV